MRSGTLALGLAAGLLAADARAAPDQIRLGWQGPTDTTMTVTWRSAEPAGAVEYGPDPSRGARAAARSAPFAGGFLHRAGLSGLAPGTRYHYRCGTEGAWSADLTFATGPARGSMTPFTFAVHGDSRSDDAARARVRAAVQARQPAFSIMTGDYVFDGEVQAEWDRWFATMEPLASRSPLMPAIGNHEVRSPLYFEQFPLPARPPGAPADADPAYYSFDYGQVHFVALSTEPMGEPGGPQQTWLRQDLARAAADPAIRWVVAFGHRPPYGSSGHRSDEKVQALWVPAFESLGVDVSFWGHNHIYERTRPLFQGRVAEVGGATYVVTGGGGAPLNPAVGAEFTAHTRSVHHFVEVSVEGATLRLQARDVSGEVFDSVVLAKPSPKPRFVLDGRLDAGARRMARGSGVLGGLWADFDGRHLYVAARGAGGRDCYVLVATERPGKNRVAAPGKKRGKVWGHAQALVLDGGSRWSGWQDRAGQGDPAWTRAANPGGEVMEGTVDLVARYGGLPARVYLAALAYPVSEGAALEAMLPAADGDREVEWGEWVVVEIAGGAAGAR